LIRRASNTGDKRIQNVFLTEKGMAAHKEIERIFSNVDEECFEGFTEAEREQTIDLLNRLGKNLKKRVDNDV
jgi:DNA-binding MarR family transcriptional regulator